MSLLDTPLPSDSAVDEPDAWWIRVTDLKQYSYCPRVTYYMYCLPHLRPTTYKMQAGIDAQERVSALEERRSLQAYGVSRGERHFYVPVKSRALGCVGQVDMVIETHEAGQHRLIPVDYKLSRHPPGRHFQLQVACYGMMLEEMYGVPVSEGFLYLTPSRQAERVAMTQRLRREVATTMATIRALVGTQQMPPATKHRAQCVACEYRRFCNDVL